ncbi:hypothetical protein [Streptomyces sp. MST-110588]|uniref:hypothetical protein n=1 Tax=Streptomyces sp. MST-110588 TaxID=2833628 RepID=UPI001F5D0728|nr:hypothetical protein [Streptomyces sp. MST-110588]UNO38845.1 hypothetical protein KGS77_03285 [Streptomyces sp. MST-110588]
MDKVQAALEQAMLVRGTVGVAVVDIRSRSVLGFVGTGGGPDMDKVAYGDSDVVRAKLYTLELLGYPPESVEDILITLPDEYHLIRPLPKRREQGIFIYLVLDRHSVSLAAAREELTDLESRLEM